MGFVVVVVVVVASFALLPSLTFSDERSFHARRALALHFEPIYERNFNRLNYDRKGIIILSTIII